MLSYTVITDFLQSDIRHQQLQQVAENVALNLVEITNLANFGNSANGTMTRTLHLPADLAEKTYIIQIVNDTSQLNSCYIKAYLVTSPTVSAMSIIPLQANQSQVTLITDSGSLAGNQNIAYGSELYGGADSTVVWAWKGSGTTWAGIGRLTGGG